MTDALWTSTKQWLLSRSQRPRDKAKIRKLKLRVCDNIPDDLPAGDKSRYYSHTGHFSNTICISRDFGRLPAKNRAAILIHECGHILSGLGDEPSADLYMLDNFAIQIQYKGAKELQYVDVNFK